MATNSIILLSIDYTENSFQRNWLNDRSCHIQIYLFVFVFVFFLSDTKIRNLAVLSPTNSMGILIIVIGHFFATTRNNMQWFN